MEIPLPRENLNFKSNINYEKTFIDSYHSNSFHHAWLISGPKGIGKSTLAYRFARFILSQKNDQNNHKLFPDNNSNKESLDLTPDNLIYKKIVSNSHSDLMIIEPLKDQSGKSKKSISISEIRKIKPFLNTTSITGSWKVIIIDSMDELTINAENALLKSLEEPPRKTLIILIATNSSQLLPTTISRCRNLPIFPLSKDMLSTLINIYLPDLDSDDNRILSSISEGSIGKALNLYENNGIEIFKELVNLYSNLPSIDINKVNKISEAWSKENLFKIVIELLCWWISRIIKYISLNDFSEYDETVSNDRNVSENIARLINLEELLNILENIDDKYNKANILNLDRRNIIYTSIMGLPNSILK